MSKPNPHHAPFTPRYPSWICGDCGQKHGRWPHENHVATWHQGRCGWCGDEKSVTEPRDFCYPLHPSLIRLEEWRKHEK